MAYKSTAAVCGYFQHQHQHQHRQKLNAARLAYECKRLVVRRSARRCCVVLLSIAKNLFPLVCNLIVAGGGVGVAPICFNAVRLAYECKRFVARRCCAAVLLFFRVSSTSLPKHKSSLVLCLDRLTVSSTAGNRRENSAQRPQNWVFRRNPLVPVWN